MRYTEFKYGKYYSSFSLARHRLCITIGEDFNYKLLVWKNGHYHTIENDDKLLVWKDGHYHTIENDYKLLDLTEEYFELQ